MPAIRVQFRSQILILSTSTGENGEKMNTATYIGKVKSFMGDARIYRMEPPYEDSEYVVVSGVDVPFSGPETYIFKSDADGSVKDFGELPGSFRGDINHARALRNAGYEVE